MFGKNEKLDQIIELLEGLKELYERSLNQIKLNTMNNDENYIIWLEDQLEFYKTRRNERRGIRKEDVNVQEKSESEYPFNLQGSGSLKIVDESGTGANE